MVFKQVYVILFLLMILSTGVFAFDSSQWDECLTEYTEDQCRTFCDQNTKGFSCSYPDEIKRTFTSELYPVNCENPQKEWNKTEEVTWVLEYNVDAQNTNERSKACNSYGDKAFDNYYKKHNYKVPYRFNNFVKLYDSLYINDYGVPFLLKPSKSELRDMYPDITNARLNQMYNNLEKQPTQDNMFTFLGCNFDCDYTGSDDNELQGQHFAYDYTYSTKFVSQKNGVTWREIFENDAESICETSWWDFLNLYGYISECLFAKSVSFFSSIWADLGLLNGTYAIDPENPYDKNYDYYYSKTPNAVNSFTCNYPKSEYEDTQVQVRTRCYLGKSWESIMHLPESTSEIEWENLGFENCKNGEAMCEVDTYVNFYLNSTSNHIEFIDGETVDENKTSSEIINDAVRDLKIPYYGTEPTEEDQQRLFSQYAVFRRDTNRDNAVLQTLGLSEYILSFIIIIIYIVQFALFISIWMIILNSFKALRRTFKELTNLKKFKRDY